MIGKLRRLGGYLLLGASVLAAMMTGCKVTLGKHSQAVCYLILLALAAGVLAAMYLRPQ